MNIRDNMDVKLGGQTTRVVLNLTDSAVSIEELKSVLKANPIKGLHEIIIVKGNQVIPFFPFE
jgi:hypothetical protein